ncbi:hypothetical protein QEN19_000533 [Hanseniaspora menglaensis]
MSNITSRSTPFGNLFQKSLHDLIVSIRSCQRDPVALNETLSNILKECKDEVVSNNMHKKSTAILKLTYLEMYGYDISWCSFHVLEVMSSSNFQEKRIGYLAAQQAFRNDPEMLTLATNCLKKDLTSHKKLDIGISMSGVSSIVTTNLARDISEDLFKMTRHGDPYIRKKTTAALGKLFLQYPEALRDGIEEFFQLLQDPNDSVVLVSLGVIYEVCRINPSPFMKYMPFFYDMFADIENKVWMTITLLKIFTILARHEPKLKQKLLPVIWSLMDHSADSLKYECYNCIVNGNLLYEDDYELANDILTELKVFCISQDPNLRYVSCLLFHKIACINKEFITINNNFENLILNFLEDPDIIIRGKAIDLLEHIVNSKNIEFIVKDLLNSFKEDETSKVTTPGYKIGVINTILKLFVFNDYENINDFNWYLDILVSFLHEISILQTSVDLITKSTIEEIGNQLNNVCLKVPDLREYTLFKFLELITEEKTYLSYNYVLKNAYWCIGEFADEISDCESMIIAILSNNDWLKKLSSDSLATLLPCLLKLLKTFSLEINEIQDPSMFERLVFIGSLMLQFFTVISDCKNIEVQERLNEFTELIKIILETVSFAKENQKEGESCQLPELITNVLPCLFDSWDIKPIHKSQQIKLQHKLDLSYLDAVEFLNKEDRHSLDTLIKTLKKSENGKNKTSFRKYKRVYGDTMAGGDPLYNINSDDDYDDELNKHDVSNQGLLHHEEDQRLIDHLKKIKSERKDNPFYLDEDDGDEIVETIYDKADESSGVINDDDDDSKPSFHKENIIKLKSNVKSKKLKIICDAKFDSDEDMVQDLDSYKPLHKKLLKSHDIDVVGPNLLQSFDFNSEASEHITVNDNKNIHSMYEDKNSYQEEPIIEEEIIIVKKKKKGKKSSKKKSKDEGEKLLHDIKSNS